jgi:hypothetical protein
MFVNIKRNVEGLEVIVDRSSFVAGGYEQNCFGSTCPLTSNLFVSLHCLSVLVTVTESAHCKTDGN